MRRISWIFAILLGVSATAAEAQSDAPKVELAGSVGILSAMPGENLTEYQDSWYGQGRYAGSIAYYWTRHLKTEFEHQWSHEGERNFLEYARVNGMPYSYRVTTFHQLQQSSLRMVWQFRNNSWVHPYVSAGAVVDFERQHYHVPAVYHQPLNGERVLLRREMDSGHRTELRGGWTIGGGAKFYMTKKAFFNAGANATFSMPTAKTVSVIAGFGVEF
jgi:opacity protein-like surface antigen